MVAETKSDLVKELGSQSTKADLVELLGSRLKKDEISKLLDDDSEGTKDELLRKLRSRTKDELVQAVESRLTKDEIEKAVAAHDDSEDSEGKRSPSNEKRDEQRNERHDEQRNEQRTDARSGQHDEIGHNAPAASTTRSSTGTPSSSGRRRHDRPPLRSRLRAPRHSCPAHACESTSRACLCSACSSARARPPQERSSA